LFSVGALQEMVQLRDMPDDFGVVPFPKFNEEQARYYTRVIGGFPFVVPGTNARPEIAGALMETMACETRNTVIPAYYESSLQEKFARDLDTAEMLDLMFETKVYDLGDTIWFSPIRVDYTGVFTSGRNTFASLTERNAEKYNQLIEKVVESILGN
jgi:ABC-type glycerol-3-phosphate transport system substrate-binding protein